MRGRRPRARRARRRTPLRTLARPCPGRAGRFRARAGRPASPPRRSRVGRSVSGEHLRAAEPVRLGAGRAAPLLAALTQPPSAFADPAGLPRRVADDEGVIRPAGGSGGATPRPPPPALPAGARRPPPPLPALPPPPSAFAAPAGLARRVADDEGVIRPAG